MADTSYQPKVYRKHGGLEWVIASGGKLTFETGSKWLGNSTQAATIAAQTTAHTTHANAPTMTEVDTISAKLNEMIQRLQELGIVP